MKRCIVFFFYSPFHSRKYFLSACTRFSPTKFSWLFHYLSNIEPVFFFCSSIRVLYRGFSNTFVHFIKQTEICSYICRSFYHSNHKYQIFYCIASKEGLCSWSSFGLTLLRIRFISIWISLIMWLSKLIDRWSSHVFSSVTLRICLY